jgi:hypothetical protein
VLQLTTHPVPLQATVPFAGAVQTLLHEPQVESDDRLLSHPLVSGAVRLQSAHPAAQPVYVHVVPVQPAPRLWVVSQEFPHPAHAVMDDKLVEQPPVLGGVVLQSA